MQILLNSHTHNVRTLVICGETGRLLAINQKGETLSEPSKNVSFRIDRKDPFKAEYTSLVTSAPVTLLSKEMYMPMTKIRRMMMGPVEQFRAEIGFCNPEETPETTTIAIWMMFKAGAPKFHEFIAAGPPANISFKLGQLGGHDGLPMGNPDTEISATINLDTLYFKPGSNVTAWCLLKELFQDSWSAPGAIIDWDTGYPVYVRFRIEADRNSNDLRSQLFLSLEALPLKNGRTLDSLPDHHQEVLSSGAAKTFKLWSVSAVWHAPNSRTGLATTPGIHDTVDTSPISDSLLRWYIAWIFDLTRRGSYTTGEDWDTYLEEPHKIHEQTEVVPYALVVHTSEGHEPPPSEGTLIDL